MRDLDVMGAADFAAAVAPLFEGAPRFVERLAAGRPYGTYEALLERALAAAQTMPHAEQVALLASHPRIGAAPESVSELSYREQGYDRQDAARSELGSELDRLNAEYEQRFGFRFVIFVAGRPRDEIARTMAVLMERDRDAEKRRALNDVVAIARARLRAMASEEGP